MDLRSIFYKFINILRFNPRLALKIVIFKFINPIKNILTIPLWLFCKIIPLKNTIVFNQFDGNGYADNLKYIAEELYAQKNDLKLYWLISNELDRKSLPEFIIPVKYGSIKNIIIMAIAKIWISNVRIGHTIYKRKCQKYIQTWHGCLCFKKIEYDARDKLSKSYIKKAIRDSKLIDLFISDGTACTKAIPKTFWYNYEILTSGMPRNDVFARISSDTAKKIKNQLGINLTQKVVLYAPTFRFNYSTDPYNVNLNSCAKALNNRFGGDWYFLVRLHPRMKGLNMCLNREEILDVSYYPDIQELLLISDVVISDYSSLVFDYAHLKRPVFLYTPDYDEYMRDRGLYREKAEYPFSFSYTNKELVKNILNFDNQDYVERLNVFFEKEGFVKPGGASYKIVKKIINEYLI